MVVGEEFNPVLISDLEGSFPKSQVCGCTVLKNKKPTRLGGKALFPNKRIGMS